MCFAHLKYAYLIFDMFLMLDNKKLEELRDILCQSNNFLY